MAYANNTEAALRACERERTGNYGADEYKETEVKETNVRIPLHYLSKEYRDWSEKVSYYEPCFD